MGGHLLGWAILGVTMCTPDINAIKNLGWLVPTLFNVILVIAGWLVLRRRNRVDKLRETWANWTASALEAVETQSAVIERDEQITRGLQVDEAKIGPGVADSCELLRAEQLAPALTAAADAARRLLRDHHMLELLEDDDRVLETANSLTNPLVRRNAVKETLNTIQLMVVQLASGNRRRFLRRFRWWKTSGDMPGPFPDPLIESLEKNGWVSPATPGDRKQP